MRAVDAGWVYVIANPAMPNVCKIGMTTRTPEARAAELHDTGSPAPYHVVGKWHVPDVRAAERDAHAALGPYRADTGREWFTLPADRAVRALDRLYGLTRPKRRVWRIVRGIVEAIGWAGIALTAIALAMS